MNFNLKFKLRSGGRGAARGLPFKALAGGAPIQNPHGASIPRPSPFLRSLGELFRPELPAAPAPVRRPRRACAASSPGSSEAFALEQCDIVNVLVGGLPHAAYDALRMIRATPPAREARPPGGPPRGSAWPSSALGPRRRRRRWEVRGRRERARARRPGGAVFSSLFLWKGVPVPTRSLARAKNLPSGFFPSGFFGCEPARLGALPRGGGGPRPRL